MKKVFAIAWLTIRESLRQKLAVNLLLFALVLIAASITLSTLTFGEQYRIVADLALTAAQLFGTLIAVFVGAGIISGEIQRRSIHAVLAKPVSRGQYLLGRYVGLFAILTLNLAVMGLGSFAVLVIHEGQPALAAWGSITAAFVGIGAQLALVGAIATLFSSFTNTTLAAIFSLAFTFAGHFTRDVVAYWWENGLLRAVGMALPNLAALDFKVNVVYREPVALGQLTLGLCYAVLYVAVLLAVAMVGFSRRDLR